MSRVHIDSFSESVGGLSTKKRRDARTVLEILARDPNVSTWDMDEHKRFPLWRTIQDLESRGFIVSAERSYPLLRYEITEAGKKFLSAQQKRAADFRRSRGALHIEGLDAVEEIRKLRGG